MARIPRVIVGGCCAAAAGLAALLGPAAAPAGAAPDAATLYQEAIATTKAWTVHYSSESGSAHVPFFESGDAGPASGTQTIRVGQGATLDRASLVVIGDLTYVKGNRVAMEDLTGLTSAQAAVAQGHWVLFSSDNPEFSQVVVGVRSHDVAQEIALEGPYTLGPPRTLEGYKVDTVRGRQKLTGRKTMGAVLYVRAATPHLVVEEVSVGAHGKPNGDEHIVFSRWGERVRPRAPTAAITLGSVNAT